MESLAFDFDECAYHGAVGRFGNPRFQPGFIGKAAHLGDDLLNTLGRFHVRMRRFETASLLHEATALGHQTDDLAVKAVDVGTDLVE